MSWGTKEYQALFKSMREDGLVHPAEAKKIALEDRDRRYYDAYRSLSASRMWSQIGPNPIQVSEVASYLGLCGIEDPVTKLKYLKIIQGLDIIEIKNIRARSNKK